MMKRLLTLSLATITALGLAASAWSQAGGGAGGSGGTGGAGVSGSAGAGASGSAGAGASGTSGTAGVGANPVTAGTTGAAGATGTAGVRTNAGTPGTAGQAGAAGTAGAAGQAGAAGTAGREGTAGTAGASGSTNGVSGASGTGANLRPSTAASAAGTRANPNNQALLNANQNASFNRIGQRPFFADPGARRQLNLNDNQFNSLNRAYQDAYNRYNQSVSELNSSLTPQQRQAQIQQIATQFDNDFNRSLDRTFTDPRLRGRYDQLNRQYMGFDAFNDAAIQRQMNLTPQQQQQLRQLTAQWRDQMNQFGTASDVDMNQWSQMSAMYYDQLNSMLTPEQRDTWQQLTGERYDFPPTVYFNTNGVQGSAANPPLPTRRSNSGSLNNRGTVGQTPGNPGSGFAPEVQSSQGNATSNPGSRPRASADGGIRSGSSNSGSRSSGSTR